MCRWLRVTVVGLLVVWLAAVSPAVGSTRRKAEDHRALSSVHGVDFDSSFFAKWRSAKELAGFAEELAKRHKNDRLAKISTIGHSAEKRPLTLLTIGPAQPKYQLMLMGAMHGREWITPHAVLYVAARILHEAASGVPQSVDLLKDTAVHFLPLLNPDGYEYTRKAGNSEVAQSWRKNRRNLCSKCERGVHGIDLNRNWGIKGKSWGFGADRATSEVYQGKNPFSEPENKAVRDWLLHKKRGQSINGFFDVHCCSGAVLPPFYYKGESEELKATNLANCGKVARAMKVNGKRYKFRPREDKFSDSNTGIGLDWIYAEGGVQNAFIVETRGNGTELKYIFNLPESDIVPISKELEAGFWKMAEIIRGNEKMDPSPAESGEDEASEEPASREAPLEDQARPVETMPETRVKPAEPKATKDPSSSPAMALNVEDAKTHDLDYILSSFAEALGEAKTHAPKKESTPVKVQQVGTEATTTTAQQQVIDDAEFELELGELEEEEEEAAEDIKAQQQHLVQVEAQQHRKESESQPSAPFEEEPLDTEVEDNMQEQPLDIDEDDEVEQDVEGTGQHVGTVEEQSQANDVGFEEPGDFEKDETDDAVTMGSSAIPEQNREQRVPNLRMQSEELAGEADDTFTEEDQTEHPWLEDSGEVQVEKQTEERPADVTLEEMFQALALSSAQERVKLVKPKLDGELDEEEPAFDSSPKHDQPDDEGHTLFGLDLDAYEDASVIDEEKLNNVADRILGENDDASKNEHRLRFKYRDVLRSTSLKHRAGLEQAEGGIDGASLSLTQLGPTRPLHSSSGLFPAFLTVPVAVFVAGALYYRKRRRERRLVKIL